MAWTEGAFTTAAGQIKDILDTLLVANAYWSIEDAGAGANIGVYRCLDVARNCDFVLKVGDNQANYAMIEVWEDWDSVGHAGVGAKIGDMSTSYVIRHPANGAYGISVLDHRFIFVNIQSQFAYYIGQPRRFDETKNTPVMLVHTSAAAENPLGFTPQSAAYEFRCLFDHAGDARTLDFFRNAAAALPRANIRAANNVCWVAETCIADRTNYWALGVLEGGMALGNATNLLANDTVTDEDSNEWLVVQVGATGLVRKT